MSLSVIPTIWQEVIDRMIDKLPQKDHCKVTVNRLQSVMAMLYTYRFQSVRVDRGFT